MSDSYSAWGHKVWREAGLKDFGDYSDCVEYINQLGHSDGQLEGEWWYADDRRGDLCDRFGLSPDVPDCVLRDRLIDEGMEAEADDPVVGVIYSGSFGNYNSPGADAYTNAEVFDDLEEYRAEVARWEGMPEYLEEDEEGFDEGSVEYDIECYPEEAPVEGNCSAIDAETDRAQEEWIREQLEGGNEWAWCRVRVVARRGDHEGDDHLGCCSYRSEQDFVNNSGYYEDMRREALSRLRETVEA
jgi:hypothetical protein